MMYGDSAACEYWVVFTGSNKKHILLDRLDKCFRHVLLVKKSQGKTMWLIIDPRGGNILLESVPVSITPTVRDMYPDAVIIKTKSKTQRQIPYKIWHINCVEIAKRVLGIKKWWIITPFQLYKHLKRG